MYNQPLNLNLQNGFQYFIITTDFITFSERYTKSINYLKKEAIHK